MTSYLFIHGRGQEGKKADAMLASWLKALNAGFATAGGDDVEVADVRLPYYGDALAGLVTKRGGKAMSPDLESFDPAQRLLAEMAAEAAQETGWQPAVETQEIGLPGFLAPALNWLADHSALDERIIRSHLADVAYYLADDEIRTAVLDIVLDSLQDLPGPVVVIGHSLGSVVAYDLVTDERLPKDIDVPLLLTAGSPLGLSIVRKNLPSGASFPTRVDRWASAYSRNDPVAIGHPIAGFYKDGKPGRRAVDDLKVSNPDDAAHSIAAYLGHKATAKALIGAA